MEYFEYSLNGFGDAYSITKYVGKAKTVVIPNTMNGKPIYKIDSYAFEMTTIEEVRFERGHCLMYIDDCAFYNCTMLKNVVINGGVDWINSRAFSGCSNLEHVVLSECVKGIYPKAFEGCSNLQSVRIDSAHPMIYQGAFQGCSKATFEGYQFRCPDGLYYGVRMD